MSRGSLLPLSLPLILLAAGFGLLLLLPATALTLFAFFVVLLPLFTTTVHSRSLSVGGNSGHLPKRHTCPPNSKPPINPSSSCSLLASERLTLPNSFALPSFHWQNFVVCPRRPRLSQLP